MIDKFYKYPAFVAMISFMYLGALTLRAEEINLSSQGQVLEQQYHQELISLQSELLKKVMKVKSASQRASIIKSSELDAKLAKFVVLHEASPKTLASFAQQSAEHAKLISGLLQDNELMVQMLIADGAKQPHIGRSLGVSQYGPAIKIYRGIQKANGLANEGLFQRLALAISLEHAVPIVQVNPESAVNAPEFVDPLKRYQHYEKAYLDGELDTNFRNLSVWELRMVVNGDEPNDVLTWGRKTLRNYRPDHVTKSAEGWRYVGIVTSDVNYGSGDVKYDLPDLQKYQNILMNGGVCGRRAFFGRFILRAFGVPTIARPSRGHGALARYTSEGWTVCLGGGWGAGWTKTLYVKDKDFLASSQARKDQEAFLQVKRAQWIGSVLGEKTIYGEHDKNEPGVWNDLALKKQSEIIQDLKSKPLKALGANLGEADGKSYEKGSSPQLAQLDRKIKYNSDGSILIAAAAYNQDGAKGVTSMKSFDGGSQIFLPRFDLQGKTLLRGGSWKGDAKACSSGWRLPSSGYGQYENWGFRAAMTHSGGLAPKELSIKINDEVSIDFVYIKPGSFTMGGESKTDSKWTCVELPKHQVNITKGFYLGKYEITQSQFEAVMAYNPSRSTKGLNYPVDNVSWKEALKFCENISLKSKKKIRLPSEAEWEYAARVGSSGKWFFGKDATQLDQYAWNKNNAGKKSHEVGQKKPNPWGLYDVYGNVLERVADIYDKNYYAESPQNDPKGPQQELKTQFEYEIEVTKSGVYSLTSMIVTNKHSQILSLELNQQRHDIFLPFTLGEWQETSPIKVKLNHGKNTLRFYRNSPPQKGVAIKSFLLQ
ncbi:SUMF1/EgtB/PvdO family nonheme iron enzyme [Lentisphaera marina]|uniref:SUMF1/EgtB/PvdO family nonheme iron enzyme n=1 Tax=Lentisphaera marina TaxID=1111041 RepID=UPI0023671F39|nr:SUMF1/EgtB/PvdO family nonheme iron enzyme [Lentisphaera marina]MDD7983903.1 SUMF1/EgtB/PvdO family nonheme iron enzyme [Lentisphaera marina]